jgi:hypothetical protein
MFLQTMTIRTAAFLTATFALIVATAQAGEPRYSDLKFSANEDNASPTEVFTPDTPKIFLHAALVDVASGAKLSGTWIAEKTDAAPPNYKIDSVTMTAGMITNVATFSLSKPTAGWPVGDYRVELAIDDKPAGSAHFKIAGKTAED